MVGNRYSKSTFGASNCFVNNHFRDELQYECYFLFLLKSLYSSCLFSWCTVYIVHTSALKSSANCFFLLFPRISPFCIFWGKLCRPIYWRQYLCNSRDNPFTSAAQICHSDLISGSGHLERDAVSVKIEEWDGALEKTLPKAQRTRGLSSSYQRNFLRSYHEFKHK